MKPLPVFSQKRLSSDIQIPYRPWVYGLIFLVAEGTLTYGSFQGNIRFWSLAFGLILPFVLALQGNPPSPKKDPWVKHLEFPLGFTGFVTLLVLASTAFYLWPCVNPDSWLGEVEATTGLGALQLLNHLEFRLFHDFGQNPTTDWFLCYGFLRLTGAPLLSLHLPAALVSLLTLAVGYVACRRFFPRYFSLLFTALWAFNYWVVRNNQVLLCPIYLPLWQGLVALTWGNYWKAAREGSSKGWLAATGFVLGLGYLTFTSWLSVLLFMVPFVTMFAGRKPHHQSPLVFFFVPLGLSLVPLGWQIWVGHFGQHMMGAASRGQVEWQWLGRGTDYLAMLFFGGPKGLFAPEGGGFLNPCWAAFFWVGVLELAHHRKKSYALLFLAAFGVFLLPGIIAGGIETYRILPVLPLLVLVSATGLQAFVESVGKGLQRIVLSTALLLGIGMDIARLGPLPGFKPAAVLDEQRECYRILRGVSRQQGPGYIFSAFTPEPQDFSLVYATYPFNAALESPGSKTVFPAKNLKWAAILTENHYRPFLTARFPEAQWFQFQTEKPGILSRHELALVALDSSSRALFFRWREFNKIYQSINLRILDLAQNHSREGLLRDLVDFYPQVPEDPFLRSCFFEKLAFNYSWEKTFHPEDTWTRWENFSGVFQDSFSKGYQDVVLCEKMGRLYASEGMNGEAYRMFEKALTQDPQNPLLKDELLQVRPEKKKL